MCRQINFVTGRLHSFLLLLLLGVLFSYNLDLECFLAPTDTVCQAACLESGEDNCSDPLIGSSPGSALPTSEFQLSFSAVQPTDCALSFPPIAPPLESSVHLPVGLRAPPQSPAITT